jgi:hypothetical protein
MSRIQTSIHGKHVGLNYDKALQAGEGFVAGEHGNQITLPAPGKVSWFDDFIGDALDAKYAIVEGTDSATSDATIASGGIGGVLDILTGDAGTGLAADLIGVVGPLQWQASNGGLVFQARVRLSAITTCYAFLGFTDVATLEAPIISASGTTFTSNASDAVGFMFDTGMTSDNWWLTGVAADTDATMQDSGFAPVADDYATFRIEVNASGVATFFYNGLQVGTSMTGAVTPATDLCSVLYCSKLSVAASMHMYVDYLHVAMNRAADGAAV